MQGTKAAQSLKRYTLADIDKHTLEREGGLDKKRPMMLDKLDCT